ncbi:TIR domain-containing protein [uncultured Cardiobacterium sp.]|uniref:TIR domain-containing protein n=1 Tax=uncultured Cardiobacterium sp. TaxID=417619 RepID=UPI00262258A8|nr:TIR domain-containing protein [uncultured Cardiobacterium sp.]
MDILEAEKILADKGYEFERRLIANGNQLKIRNGTVVNFYSTGRIQYQGKNVKEIQNMLDDSNPSVENKTINNKVFVVYGHDKNAKVQLELMLRKWRLEPLILDQLPSNGQTIIEKLESYTKDVQFAVVLATPDDQGHRSDHPDEIAYRARQNVVLELGMLLAKLGRSRVAILLKQQESFERPSDIQGLMYIPFKDDLEKDAGINLAKEMCEHGYKINILN